MKRIRFSMRTWMVIVAIVSVATVSYGLSWNYKNVPAYPGWHLGSRGLVGSWAVEYYEYKRGLPYWTWEFSFTPIGERPAIELRVHNFDTCH